VYLTNALRQQAYRQRQQRQVKVYHRSKREDWGTPPDFFQALDTEFGFTLDAAASPANALCPRYWTKADNALVQPWTGIVFLNPPYGRGIEKWGHPLKAGHCYTTMVSGL
jgi:phage N-6-adenine-methyltransferase